MKLILIECRTGCTCCSSDNHYRGPYKTVDDAKRRIASFLAPDSKFWPVASQYAHRGNYSVQEVEAEQLPDGRIIVGESRVYPETTCIEVNPDGMISSDHKNEVFAYDLY